MGRPKKAISQKNIERFVQELELAGDRADLLLQDKKGRSKSCLLCRRRKQKCDHKLPSCTACLKAAVKCIQPVRYNSVSEKKPDSKGKLTPSDSNDEENSKSSTPSFKVTDKTYLSSVPSTQNIVNTIDIDNKAIKSESVNLTKRVNPIKVKKNTTTAYNSFLEKKLSYLESLIDLKPGSEAYQVKLSKYKKICHLLNGVDDLESLLSSSQESLENSSQNVHKLPMLSANQSLFNDNYSHSKHSSYSNAIYPPKNDEQNGPHQFQNIPALTSDSVDSIDTSKCIFAKYNLKQFLSYYPVFEFDSKLSRLFLDTYFTRMQFKYPLLDEQKIYAFHHYYINNKIYGFSETEFHFSCSRMWLIFSISASLTITTDKNKILPPIRYFSTAIRHVTRCGNNLSPLQKIELKILLILYLVRTDQDSSVSYQIMQSIMKIAKNELHLHKYNPHDPNVNRNMRIFWSIYLLERLICISVWKPYTIKESEIQLPFLNQEAMATLGKADVDSVAHGLYFLNQSLMLTRIESQFVEGLNLIPQVQVKKEVLQEQLSLVKKYFHELELWRQGCIMSSFKNYEKDTLKLSYYRAVKLLIQPYLSVLNIEDRLFRECQASAGQICQLYKTFYQRTDYGHSTPAVHTVFVAGVTLIYCMWLSRNFDDQKRKRLGDSTAHTRPLISATLFSTMDDLRACSVCLYAMTERTDFARTFRDTFDQLMSATIGNLMQRCGPDSSELIYKLSGKGNIIIEEAPGSKSETGDERQFVGMPPAVHRVFGDKQGQEYLGLVRSSPIAHEERIQYEKRKDVIENSSIPKGLAHLLTETSSETNADDTPQLQKTTSSSSDSALIPLMNHQGETTYQTDGISSISVDKEQYFVRKPEMIDSAEWESYKEQALSQQNIARHNLQMYLRSLKNAAGLQSSSMITTESCPTASDKDSIKNQVPRMIKVSGDTYFGNQYNAKLAKNCSAIVNLLSSDIDQTNNKTNLGFSGPTSRTGSIQQLPMINPVPIDLCEENLLYSNAALASTVLSNSGAKDMINDISMWTTASLESLEKQELINQDMFTQTNSFTHADNSVPFDTQKSAFNVEKDYVASSSMTPLSQQSSNSVVSAMSEVGVTE